MTSHSAAACALLSSTLVLLLLAGTAGGSASNGDAVSAGNVTATITSGGNSSSGTTTPVVNNGDEMYICYLCSGRNPMLIHWCPIYWDECHLNCEETKSAATVAVTDAKSGPAVSPAVLPGEMLDNDPPGNNDECYVMKLYKDGRYVIVQDLKCGETRSCRLTCGGGEVLDTGNAQGPATAAAPVPVPVGAAFQDPRLADFQRCGDMVHRSGDPSGRKG